MASSPTKLNDYLGGPKMLLPTELPTLRNCLQRCLDLQQKQFRTHNKDYRSVSLHEIFHDVAFEIWERWSSSNSDLKEPVVCSTNAIRIYQRLSYSWSTFYDIAKDKARKAIKEKWKPKLDKLFDIALCTCRIVRCGEGDAPCKEVTCDLNLRLPNKELLWIKAQREKEPPFKPPLPLLRLMLITSEMTWKLMNLIMK